jgi:regulator of RNase E activity RraB
MSDEEHETEEMEPARIICIEIVATTEQGEAELDRVSRELGAIMEAAAKQYKFPKGVEFDQMAVEDPDSDEPEDAEDQDRGDGI